MPVFNFGCIVEGHGEVDAIRILLERIGFDINPECYIHCAYILRVSKDKLIRPGELERSIEAVGRCSQTIDGVFILIDADKDCPASLGPQLRQRAESVQTNIPKGLVLAKHEYEAWFVTSFKSIAQLHGISAVPELLGVNPEEIRGAKEWLTKHLGFKYVETRHQAGLTRQFDLTSARAASSFDKCYREVRGLLNLIQNSPL